MPRTTLPDFATLTEFGAYHGDCGELATLAALHSVDPAAWPLTLATLNALTASELAAGNADPALSGGQNIPNLDAYLTRLGVAHTTTGYAAFALDALHTTLKTLAGVKPVIVEWANAGALPGDGATVRYHYSTCGGIDTGPAGDGAGGGYLWADGDNRASGATPTPPILYTWQDIVAAQPIAFIVIDQPRKEPQPVAITIEHDGAGNITGGHDEQGQHIGAGFALAAQNLDLLGAAIVIPETPEAGMAVAVVGNTLMTYDGTVNTTSAQDVVKLVLSVWNGRAAALAARDAATAQAQAAIAAQAQEQTAAAQDEAQEAAQLAPGAAEGVPIFHAMGAQDTYQSIAAEYYGGDSSDAAVQRILSANGIPNDGVRYVGRVLVIPPAPVAVATPAQA